MFIRFVALLVICSSVTASLLSDEPPSSPGITVRLQSARAKAALAKAAVAEHRFRLDQLGHLKGEGHASWSELAEQRVALNKSESELHALNARLEILRDLERRITKLNSPETTIGENINEAIVRLDHNASNVVAWIPSTVASPALLRQAIIDLEQQREGLLEGTIEQSAQKLDNARRRIAVYDKSGLDSVWRTRADLQLARAKAEHDLVIANHQYASHLQVRISRLQEQLERAKSTDVGPALLRPGTMVVGAASVAEQPSNFGTSVQLPSHYLRSPAILRHWVDLQFQRIDSVAVKESVQAELDYLKSRRERIAALPSSARPPLELVRLGERCEDVREAAASAAQRIDAASDASIRFLAQLQAQHQAPPRWVVDQRGRRVASWTAWDGSRVVQTTAVSLAMGLSGIVEGDALLSRRSVIYPYIESTIVQESLARLPRHPSEVALLNAEIDFRRQERRLRPFRSEVGKSDLRRQLERRPMSIWRSEPFDLRTFHPYEKYPMGQCQQSIYAYRTGAPTRASYPYRTSYLYRTAFPAHSNLYSSPYTRPQYGYVGFEYSARRANCFD